MTLDYVALAILIVVLLRVVYGVVAVWGIPYEIAKRRDHPHRDAIGAATWVSLFTRLGSVRPGPRYNASGAREAHSGARAAIPFPQTFSKRQWACTLVKFSDWRSSHSSWDRPTARWPSLALVADANVASWAGSGALDALPTVACRRRIGVFARAEVVTSVAMTAMNLVMILSV